MSSVISILTKASGSPNGIATQLNGSLYGPITPTVGLHANVPYEEYARWHAASNSRLGVMEQHSPAHLKYYIDHPDTEKETDAKILGSAIHFAALQPELFERKYVRGPEGDGRTKKVQEEKAQLQRDNPSARILKPDQFDTADAVREAVWNHPAARELLSAGSALETELSGAWIDPLTGLLCKMRIDRRAPEFDAIVDLKSTANAKPDTFRRSVELFGYDRQGAMYLDGSTQLGSASKHFILIAAEKDPPYAVCVCRLTNRMIRDGRAKLRPLLYRYQQCIESADFPAFGDSIIDLGPLDEPVPFITENV